MGWFSKREPQPDPIGDICRLLVEKPWEWVAGRTDEKDSRQRNPTLTHIAGVYIGWNREGSSYINNGLQVFMGMGDGCPSKYVDSSDAPRLMKAVHGNAAARIARPRTAFDNVTRAVAQAVLDGDKEAALQLADYVMEHCGATTEGT